MRFFCRFDFTRKIGIMLKKKNTPILKVENKELKIDVNKYLGQLKDNGFTQTFKIPKKSLDDIKKYLKKTKFKGQFSKKLYEINFNTPKKPGSDLWYLDHDLYKNCKSVYNLAHDSKLLDIAEKYLGREPKLYNAHAWWSFPPNEKGYQSTYGYHYDIDALKFVKFFVYITDVDIDSGPHVIISNTHKRKNIFEKINRRLTDKQVNERYNEEQINIMTGISGEGFFEDTFSYHKGTTPKKPRLILQVEYTI